MTPSPSREWIELTTTALCYQARRAGSVSSCRLAAAGQAAAPASARTSSSLSTPLEAARGALGPEIVFI